MAQKKKGMNLAGVQLWVFFLIGAVIGIFLLSYFYDKSFSMHLKTMHSRVVRDWGRIHGQVEQNYGPRDNPAKIVQN